MTDQSTQSIIDAQIALTINAEKLNCRKLALEHASKIGTTSMNSLLSDATEIYDWLVKELK